MLQHVGDGDLQQGLSEELLAHGAAVIVVFLQGRKTLRGKTRTQLGFVVFVSSSVSH